MVKKTCFIVLMCLTCLLSCKDNDVLLTPHGIIQELMAENKAISCSEDYSSKINIPSNLPKSCIVYIMNASCSYCIYSFVSFYKYEEVICSAPVCVIVDENFRQQVEFYLEQSDIEIDNKRLFLVDNANNKVLNGNIDNEDLNGHIFLIEDGHFKDHVCYIGESVMFEE